MTDRAFRCVARDRRPACWRHRCRCRSGARHRGRSRARPVARTSDAARQSAERRRIPPALARPRTHSCQRTTHRQRSADGGQDRVLPRSTHRDPARRRHADHRRRHGRVACRRHLGYNVNLYHFAYALNKPTSNVLFWVVTIVNAPREMSGVRLAIGSNAASVWWVNGKEVIGIYNDRQTVDRRRRVEAPDAEAGSKRDSRGDRERRRSHRFLRAVSR